MKDIIEDIKDFGIVYGLMIVIMLVFAGAAAMGDQKNGAGACAGIAAIFAIMYILSVIMSAVIELVNFVKGE